MHPEIEVYLSLFYRAKSDFYKGSVFALLRRAGATEEDHDVMFELSAVQAQWEFERNKSKG